MDPEALLIGAAPAVVGILGGTEQVVATPALQRHGLQRWDFWITLKARFEKNMGGYPCGFLDHLFGKLCVQVMHHRCDYSKWAS